jgi:aspartyl/asparaginyl beta-hydroxylase (cupin superfamily)
MPQASDAAGAARLRQGVNALRAGRAAEARAHFESVLVDAPEDPTHHLALAYACQALGDSAAALASADRVLALAPSNLQALSLKAEMLAQQGSDRAVDFFQAVLKASEHIDGELPVEFERLIARAQQFTRDFNEALAERMRHRIDTLTVLARGPVSARFAQSVDLLCGARRLYPSAPRLYQFPELPVVQFFDVSSFEWVEEFELATDSIRTELLGLLARTKAPEVPYLQHDPRRPQLRRDPLVGSTDWGAIFVWKDGVLVEDVAASCPRTVEALERVPLVRTPGRSPNVLFSLLQPGTHIKPHHGFVNTRLIGHLPLIVPPHCGLRVGNEVHQWEPGKVVLFDDTIEHEAWNRSDSIRVVLIFEVWRPELTPEERDAVNAVFQGVDEIRGRQAGWGI